MKPHSVGLLAGREAMPAAIVWAVIAYNALWSIDSIVLLLSGWVAPNAFGLVFVIGQALVVAGECVLRYDNETGKGDHRHIDETETVYAFSSYEKLLMDFWADVEAWRHRR